MLARFVALSTACLFVANVAYADPIGEAAAAKNEVTGELATVVRPITTGATVSAEELVKTGTDSSALLRFLDDSNLNIGASSTVRLDRFVYNPEGGAQSVVINLTKGAMRFVSAGKTHEDFTIRTPVATLGIRGTDVIAVCDEEVECAVLVGDGNVNICPEKPEIVDPKDCPTDFDLDRRRNFALIRENGSTGALRLPPSVIKAVIALVASGGAVPDPEVLAARALANPITVQPVAATRG